MGTLAKLTIQPEKGDKTALIPDGLERMARRKLNVLDPGYETGCGEPAQPCGSDNGVTRTTHSLPTLNGHS